MTTFIIFNMSSVYRPVLQDPVISERSSVPISTTCRSVENTTTGSRTPAVSSGPGPHRPIRKREKMAKNKPQKSLRASEFQLSPGEMWFDEKGRCASVPL